MKILMILVIVAIFLGVSTLRFVGDDERFAQVEAGDYQGLLGPGWIFLVPGGALVQPLSLGDEGVSRGQGLADFAGQIMPVAGDQIPEGTRVKIESFREQRIWVRPISLGTSQQAS